MKLFEIPMVVTSLAAFCLLSGSDTPVAHADFTFGTPVCTRTGWIAPCISADGLDIYFHIGNDYAARIWTAHRSSPDGEWGPPSDLGPIVNGPTFNGTAWISPNKLELYFCSNRGGNYETWVTTRTTVDGNWGAPINLGEPINEGWASLSGDGLEMYFVSGWPGGYGDWDVWMTTRETVSNNWDTPVNLGPTINTSVRENAPSVSADGLLLLFASARPGGYGGHDFYMARRATTMDPWGAPVNLGPIINTGSHENGPRVTADGLMLYFGSNRPGGVGAFDFWQAPIIRIMDFNGDGKVDAADMALLAADWGKEDSPCDIGPFAWGDGVVDEKDLAILMESLMTPGSKASDVPCDVVLSWVSPSIAKSSDVYLGTSFEAVNTASRDDPCDVLVSWGQQETTYATEAPLEFSQTYYWRVDTVLGPTNASICKGPVLSFTTEPFARPIQTIIATASSSQAGTNPQRTVDGSGLDKNDAHSTNTQDMWQSTAIPGPHWIQYEFDKIYTLHELWVWNSNQVIEPILGFGAKTVKTEYSVDGATWTVLDGVPEFARAPGKPGYVADTKVSFGGVQARYVKLTIEANWGRLSPSTGLSEVRFFYIPDRSSTQP